MPHPAATHPRPTGWVGWIVFAAVTMLMVGVFNAIDGLAEACVFSVYRRASEAPLYRIEKRPALAARQGAWAVLGQGEMILRRGHDLEQVLRFFDRGRFRVVD